MGGFKVSFFVNWFSKANIFIAKWLSLQSCKFGSRKKHSALPSFDCNSFGREICRFLSGKCTFRFQIGKPIRGTVSIPFAQKRFRMLNTFSFSVRRCRAKNTFSFSVRRCRVVTRFRF